MCTPTSSLSLLSTIHYPPHCPKRLFSMLPIAPCTSAAVSARQARDAPISAAIGEDMPDDYANRFPKRHPNDRRRAGILLHPTSLIGPHGIGDLGVEAFRFIDWLHLSGCSVWQVLPLVPPDYVGSPYSGQDANCGNTLLISLNELVIDGLLSHEELPEPVKTDRVDFASVSDLKLPLITKAAERLLLSDGELKSQLRDFQRDPTVSVWLEDAAYFAAIDDSLKTSSWYEWPEELKNRHLSAMEEIYQTKRDYIETFVAKQFLFQRQWKKLHAYARERNISIMGDMPIYVGYHSADVWANKRSFLLDRNGYPLSVSGVPPDCFSETGQLWGSPLYDWKKMNEDGYSWWVKRVRRAQVLFDEFRIDHFRGFAGYWSIPAEAKFATKGTWKAGPGRAVFDSIFRATGDIKIVAEDLGVITEDVVSLRESIDAPGMVVLQFAFGGGADNPHLPHNYQANQVVYCGTHDNDTIKGWWKAINEEEQKKALKYIPRIGDESIQTTLMRGAASSVARTAIFTMQDILELDSSARMNTPATETGNWTWRIPDSASFDTLADKALEMKQMLSVYGRTN